MIEVLRERELHRISHFQSLLESEGIRTFVRNESVSVTEASIPAFFPALCILHADDLSQAQAIIKAFTKNDSAPSDSDPRPEIPCPNCQELSPATFTNCWNCDGEIAPHVAP